MEITVLSSNDQVLTEIGQRIRAVRIDMPLTQAELASRAGVSLSTVAKIERGEDIRLSSVIGILRALDQLGAMNALVPEVVQRPSDIAQAVKVRKRASSKGKQVHYAAWSWGDDR